MPEDTAFAHVFSPGAIGTLELPHRVVMGSMHLGIESVPDGGAALAAFYAERARGGAGLIVTGGAAVSRVGAGGRSYGFINEDASAESLGGVVDAVHAEGARIALQLFHAGRYAFENAFGLQPVAPSALPSRFSGATPAALSADAIRHTIQDFARASERACSLGFDAIEVMGSEGYLVDQFLSPLTNQREDDWGGDALRRMRFGVELVRAIRSAVGSDIPLIFRFTGADLMPGSTSMQEATAFAVALADAGADALNVGIGWHESPVPTVQGIVPPGTWMPWAQRIKQAVGVVPVIAGNRVNRVALAEHLLASGQVDFVSMARPFLADAEILAKARAGTPVNVCIACNQACIDRSIADEHVSCMVNPRAGHELEYPPADRPAGGPTSRVSTRAFAVVGGGPAGLQAALTLAELGHHVELFEAAEELGGQFRLARLVPGKEDFHATIRYFTLVLEQLGVVVRLGRTVTDGDTNLLAAFDGVVLATGVLPRRLALAGAQLTHVIDYAQAFTVGVQASRVAIIGAGGIGVDLAHRLSGAHSAVGPGADVRFRYAYGLKSTAEGVPQTSPEPLVEHPHVTLMRRGKRVGARMGRSTRWVALEQLRRAGVDTCTGISYKEIVGDGVHITEPDGSSRLVAADTVVIAAGQECNDALRMPLERIGVPHRVVGGARDATELNAVRAFAEGLDAAHELARMA